MIVRGVRPHQDVHLPVVENANSPADAHDVPATRWSAFATRGRVNCPRASQVTKLDIRGIQRVDVPEVKVIGVQERRDREHGLSGLGLRVTTRLG